jgi:tRNA threonylcarbamoyladenosine biosynthesis protein TsaE
MHSTSSAETEDLAAQLGKQLKGGEVIELISDLGGGKTAFVRGLARGLGSVDKVASPTFTLSREYYSQGLTLHHYDFYRLQEAGVMQHELQEAIHDPAGVVVIEWADAVAGVLPRERLSITIKATGETTRDLTFAYPQDLGYLVEGLT